MATQEQDKLWNELSEEDKAHYQEQYAEQKTMSSGVPEMLEDLFGKENLQSEAIVEKCVEPIKEYFDKQTQNPEWNKCSEQEQQNILKIYKNHPEWTDVINALEDKFGEHNLQPKTKIRTWEDVAINKPEVWDNVNKLGQQIANCVSVGSKLYKKLVATIHIQKLIELGYGGMVTEEEWKDTSKNKWCIVPNWEDAGFHIEGVEALNSLHFIAFHSRDLAEEFMSYPENRELVKQYYTM